MASAIAVNQCRTLDQAEGQSFSEVIKAHFAPEPTVRRLRELLPTIRVGTDAIDQMDRLVERRRREPARAARR